MPRGIWKGTLGFGLVSIGVELLSAEAPERLDLDLLDRRDHARIRYRKVNEATGEEVPQEDIVRGYEVEKGEYVELSDQELKAANPKSSQTVDIIGFVPAGEIPTIYFAKPYLPRAAQGQREGVRPSPRGAGAHGAGGARPDRDPHPAVRGRGVSLRGGARRSPAPLS